MRSLFKPEDLVTVCAVEQLYPRICCLNVGESITNLFNFHFKTVSNIFYNTHKYVSSRNIISLNQNNSLAMCIFYVRVLFFFIDTL